MRTNQWKTWMKYVAVAIGIACFINVVTQGICGLVIGGAQGQAIAKISFAAVLIGLGYGIPTIIYTNDHVAEWLQVLVAFGTGSVVYVVVALWSGWIPTKHGIWIALCAIVVMLVVAFIAAIICDVLFRKSVREVNEALQLRNNR